MIEYGKIIRKRRQELNIKIVELSKKTGYSQCTISRWEKGERKITLHDFETMCKALGMIIRISEIPEEEFWEREKTNQEKKDEI